MDPREFELAWNKVVAKAWSDEGFKNRLLAEPGVVLKENGVELAPGASIKVVEDTADTRHLVLPPRPSEELTDEELAGVSGGGVWKACSYAFSPADRIARVANQISPGAQEILNR